MELGELQIKILKHILSCDSPTETVSHISRNIDALQPAVFVSTKVLIEKGILAKKGDFSKGKKKKLILTDKGIATAILAGIKHRKLDEYIDSTEYRDEYDRQRHKLFVTIMELIRVPARRNIILNRALDYMIIHGWYDEEKKVLNKKDKVYLFARLIPYIFTYPTEAGSIVDLIDKFGIDRKIFWNMLLDKLASTIQAINGYGKYIIRPGIVSPPLSPPSSLLENELHLRKMREMVDELKVLTELINTDIRHVKETVEHEKKVKLNKK
jgi:hypothetical protein